MYGFIRVVTTLLMLTYGVTIVGMQDPDPAQGDDLVEEFRTLTFDEPEDLPDHVDPLFVQCCRKIINMVDLGKPMNDGANASLIAVATALGHDFSDRMRQWLLYQYKDLFLTINPVEERKMRCWFNRSSVGVCCLEHCVFYRPNRIVEVTDNKRTVLKRVLPATDWLSKFNGLPWYNRSIVSFRSDGEIHISDAATQQRLHTLHGHAERVEAVERVPNSTCLVSASRDQTVKVWDLADDTCVTTWDDFEVPVYTVACSPCGRYIFAGATNGMITVFDQTDNQVVQTIQAHKGVLCSLSVTRCGEYCVSAGADKTIKIWNWRFGHCVRVLYRQTVGAIAVGLTPCDKYLIVNGTEGTMSLLSLPLQLHPELLTMSVIQLVLLFKLLQASGQEIKIMWLHADWVNPWCRLSLGMKNMIKEELGFRLLHTEDRRYFYHKDT